MLENEVLKMRVLFIVSSICDKHSNDENVP